MPWATNSEDGVRLYYEHDRASDDRPTDRPDTVVFLQGLGCGRWMWRWQREALSSEFDVIAPDARGTGRSDVGLSRVIRHLPGRLRRPLLAGRFGYSVGDLAADLEAVLEDAGVRDAHLVGASTGGMVAMRYALEYTRAKSLTLCGTTHGGPDAVPIPETVRGRVFGTSSTGSSERERLRQELRPAFTDRFTNRNPHLVDRIIEWRLEQDARRPAREALVGATVGFDASDRLEYCRVPTLIVHGTDDRVVPVANARLLAEKVPDSRLERIEGGSHLTVVENADRVADLLLEFLTEPEATIH